MMKDFIFRIPTKVVFGAGSIRKVGEECKKLGATKAFVVTGKTFTGRSPYFQIVVDSLKDKGIEVVAYSEVEADPSVETVDYGAEMLRKEGCDLVIGFGGGSPMDAAKSIAMLQTNEGSIRDYIHKKRKVMNPTLPIVAIPTTAGTGSEVTAAAVTTDRQTNEKIGISSDYMMPKLAIVDPEIHLEMPPSVTAATGMDALTHAIEGYVSLNAEPISDALCLHSIKMIGKHLRKAVADGKNIEARSGMVLASLIAGLGFTNVGLGAVHAVSHPIGAHFNIPHGVANGLMLPYVMEYNLMADFEKFKDIAEALGKNTSGLSLRDAAYLAVEAVAELSVDVGIPQTLGEIGIREENLPILVEHSMISRSLPSNPRRLKKEEVERIFQAAL
jgi:alcohol dehydrogenase class IV